MSKTFEASAVVPRAIIRFTMDGNILRIQTSRRLDDMERITLVHFLSDEGFVSDQFKFYTGSSYGFGYGDAGMSVVWSVEEPAKLARAMWAKPLEKKADWLVWIFGAVMAIACAALVWSIFGKH